MAYDFIDFRFDASRLDHGDWLLLGEAVSKIAHVIGVPLQPAVAARLHRMAMVRGARATTAIEGNTLSEEQVDAAVDHKLTLPPSQDYLRIEVENVIEACNAVLRDCRFPDSDSGAGAGLPRITLSWLCAQNQLILRGLTLADEVEPGCWREHRVGVGRYRAPPPERVPDLMERLVAWLEELRRPEGLPGNLRNPVQILRAILAHLYIAWIHPFGDGNGRTARLVELVLLLAAGVPSVSAHVLSNHYHKTRSVYYAELDRASKTGSPHGFITYSLQGLVDGLREQIAEIQAQQILVTWRNYVYEKIDPRTHAEKRQAHLALDLAEHPDPVRRRDLPMLTRRQAREYASTTTKTLSRDLNALSQRQLLVSTPKGWRANLDLVRAFRPFSADAAQWLG